MTKNRQDERQIPKDEPEVTASDDAVDDQVTEEEPAEIDELTLVKAERDSYLDQLQRSVAEFTNFRRRNEQERGNLVALVRKDVLSQFLPVIDDVERALSHVPEDDKEHGWVTGFTMIRAKLQGLLERSGVVEINPVNEPFDPSRHEAVATEPGSSGANVMEVYQKGYRIGDTLIRPAMVKTGDPSDETLAQDQAVTRSAPTDA